MAGDWIKMRVWLSRDPKVITIADRLAIDRRFMEWLTFPVRQSCRECAYEHVTNDVVVRVTVTGLMQIWGVTRPDGVQDNMDLVIEKSSLETLDAIAGVPGIGDAMAYVGWASEDESTHRVTLPGFFKQNASTDELRRKADSERKRRQRTKSRNVTGHVTGQSADVSRDSPQTSGDREEKRRVESINPSSSSKKRARKGQKPPADPTHQDAIDHFDAAWKNAHGGKKYPFARGKDAAAVKWMLDETGRDLGRWKAMVAMFLADAEPFVVENGHSLATMRQKFPKYVAAGRISTKAGTWVEMTPYGPIECRSPTAEDFAGFDDLPTPDEIKRQIEEDDRREQDWLRKRGASQPGPAEGGPGGPGGDVPG